MSDIVEAARKQNPVVDFFQAWFYIFLYAFKGLRFLLYDLWAMMFSSLAFKLDKSYVKASKKDTNQDLLYEKTRGSQVKAKKYKYSARTMKKYEEMKAKLAVDLQTFGATRSKTPNIYAYTVMDKNTGRIFKDTMVGYSMLDINSFLVNEGYEVFSINTSKYIRFVYGDSSILGNKMSTNDLVFFLTQLATYLKAGITLNESVKILSEQMKKDKTKSKIIRAISYDLTLGESFSNALANQGSYFPALLINMLKAAEATGTLQETLEDMANYYTEVNNTKKQMISALTYPAIITVFSIAVLTFIIIYVVPQFTQIYAQSNIEITGITAFIINLSGFLQDNLVSVIGIIVLIMVVIYLLYSKVKAVRVRMQIAFMHFPVVKNVIIYKELSIFSKTFASLLHNNVFITESMDILSKITTNEIYKAIMYKTINNIVKGEKISDAFKDHWAVPDVAYYMIVTGESTGQLADMMQKVSEYYQENHKNVVNSLKSFIEPVMIIMLAIMIGIIIIAVIVPMFQLYNGIL